MNDRRALRVWKRVALAVLATGIALIGYMVTVEGELGALPLGLVLVGAVGYAVAVLKSRRPNT